MAAKKVATQKAQTEKVKIEFSNTEKEMSTRIEGRLLTYTNLCILCILSIIFKSILLHFLKINIYDFFRRDQRKKWR